MRNYNLNIAGYNIRFEAAPGAPDLIPSERFLRNLVDDSSSDIQITVHSGKFSLPQNAERVFHAPYVEEVNGIRIHQNANFWSIWRYNSDLFIQTIFPLASIEKHAVLKFSLASKKWDLWINEGEKSCDPLEYPLDGLILYYLTVIYRDIMIHASGVNNAGHGYIFSGVSGKGKTTLARLWDDSGAKVIHDDRLILKNTGNGYRMLSTPVYNNDSPLESPVNKIFIIEHGHENRLVPVKESTAVSLVMANCIQHNWGTDIIARLLGSVSMLCAKIPIIKLSFKPDRSIIDQILVYE